jgi:hypothetical protein
MRSLGKTVRTDGKKPGQHYDKAVTGTTKARREPHIPGVPGKQGRPELDLTVDVAMVYEAAKTHASYEQLGRIFGLGASTMKDKFEEVVLKARAEAQKNLLSAQFQTAINDRNPTMQIWLGKQYLDQRDVTRVEQTGADGKPIQTQQVQAVAYIPENHRD